MIVAVAFACLLMGGCPIDPNITIEIGDEDDPNAPPAPTTQPAGNPDLPDVHYDPNQWSPPQVPSIDNQPEQVPSSGELPTQPIPPQPAVPNNDSDVQPAPVPDSPPAGPQLDQRLFGTWLRESNYWDNNAGYSSTLFYVLRLNPDGSFVYTTQIGAYNGATLLTDPSAQQGQWSTADGKLKLNYGSGSVEQAGYYTEMLAGDYLMLLSPVGGAKTMWKWAG
jgi:hypothetical protein